MRPARCISGSRAARGAAAVEMALSMIVLVPVFLYALFLDDLLRYSLEAQEAPLSTVWDATVQDHDPPSNQRGTPVASVQHNARLMFCDHESGQNRYDKRSNVTLPGGGQESRLSDCADTDHHKALVAHVCWLNHGHDQKGQQAKQVTCEQKADGGTFGERLHDAFHAKYTRGGLVQCSARALVQNYLLPTQFLPEFSDVRLVNELWKGQGDQIHQNAIAGLTTNTYFLAQQQLSLLTDTWALTPPAHQRPDERYGSGGQLSLQQRADDVQKNHPGFEVLQEATNQFLRRLLQDKLAVPRAGAPLVPALAIAPHGRSVKEPAESIREEGRSARYFHTEWRDWEGDYNKRTYEKRREGYLGCKLGEGCE